MRSTKKAATMKARSEKKRSKSGRFRLIKRIGTLRRVSTESDHKGSDYVSKEKVRVLPERDTIDETVSLDVLRRGSISPSESESEGANEVTTGKEQQMGLQLASIDSQEEDLSVSIHIWRKYP
jgi:hypothetical protein